MKTDYIELYTDYLISNNGKATATGLSAMTDNEVSHDQITRFFFKLECLKMKHHLNHFAMRAKLLIKANQMAYQESLLLKGA